MHAALLAAAADAMAGVLASWKGQAPPATTSLLQWPVPEPAAVAPGCCSCACCSGGIGFIIARLFIGFSLAAFVCCQFWCTSMFNTKVVGSANAIAAGWGNMGGGITHFLMPLIWQGLSKSAPSFIAWRWAFFVPASCHVIMGITVVLFSQV